MSTPEATASMPWAADDQHQSPPAAAGARGLHIHNAE
jgi:hypothetical protein